jgi:hypothetical protein
LAKIKERFIVLTQRVYLEFRKKGLLKTILMTPRISYTEELIFDNEYLREAEAVIGKISAIVQRTFVEPI